VVDHALEQVVRPLGAVHPQHRVDRLEPLPGLFRIGIVVTSRLTNDRATGITLATFPDGPAWKTLKAARELIAAATQDSPARLGLFVAGFSDETRPRIVDHVVAAAAAAAFELPTLRTPKKRQPAKLKHLTLLGVPSRLELAPIEAEVYGNNVARWLTLVPPNLLDAAAYRKALKQIASSHGLACEFYDEARLKQLGAGAFLAVAQGNADRNAGIVHLSYRPKGVDSASLALVGKGILFDTGGNNLKPFRNMLDMHIDMQGSTVALGTLLALAKLGVPWGADAWLAVTENRISATAYKPQDVVRALNGKTIQVIHTDAEGRMVLADTLALAANAKPKLIIDYATLTGTCVSALTENYSGVFSNPLPRMIRCSRPVEIPASASGRFRWTRISTNRCAARSPTSSSVRMRAPGITSSRRAFCRSSCRMRFPGCMSTSARAIARADSGISRPRSPASACVSRSSCSRAAPSRRKSWPRGSARERGRTGIGAAQDAEHAIADRFRGFLPVVVDVETGGFNPATDALLEIAAVMLNLNSIGDLELGDRHRYLVKPFPGGRLEPASLEVTGIDPFHPLRPAIDEHDALTQLFKDRAQRCEGTQVQSRDPGRP
jgi:hypothetical protein